MTVPFVDTRFSQLPKVERNIWVAAVLGLDYVNVALGRDQPQCAFGVNLRPKRLDAVQVEVD